jgi:hypothetical protein
LKLDSKGNEKLFNVCNVDGTAAHPEPEERSWDENESLSRGV